MSKGKGKLLEGQSFTPAQEADDAMDWRYDVRVPAAGPLVPTGFGGSTESMLSSTTGGSASTLSLQSASGKCACSACALPAP